jgi:hypothetical protein
MLCAPRTCPKTALLTPGTFPITANRTPPSAATLNTGRSAAGAWVPSWTTRAGTSRISGPSLGPVRAGVGGKFRLRRFPAPPRRVFRKPSGLPISGPSRRRAYLAARVSNPRRRPTTGVQRLHRRLRSCARARDVSRCRRHATTCPAYLPRPEGACGRSTTPGWKTSSAPVTLIPVDL